MAVNPVKFAYANTDRSPSLAVWRKCPWQDLIDGMVEGSYFEDDFLSSNITPATTEGNFAFGKGYAQFSDTGGTITNDTTELGGAVAIGSDGDNEGCSFRTLVTPFKLGQANKRFWFEARILTSTIADTKHNIFVGLMENTALTAIVPITAAGAIADKNLVGFRRTEAASGGAKIDTVYKADGVTAVTVGSQEGTLVAATYTKLGMVYEPSGDRAGSFALKFFQDGTQLATTKLIPSANGTDFPNDISLGLVFAVLNATGTTPGTSSIDWWRAAQLY